MLFESDYVKDRRDKTYQNNKCKLYEKTDETFNHVRCKYRKLAHKDFKNSLDLVVTAIHS